MWGWLVQNKQWVFDGFGIAALGVLWWLIKKFWPKSEAVVSAIQAPSTSVAPSIVMNPTINFPIEPRAPDSPKVAPPAPAAPAMPKPKPNLCVEAIKNGKISLQAEIWTLRPSTGRWEPPRRCRALLADISNVPTDEAHTAKAAIRAAIRMDYGGGCVPTHRSRGSKSSRIWLIWKQVRGRPLCWS